MDSSGVSGIKINGHKKVAEIDGENAFLHDCFKTYLFLHDNVLMKSHDEFSSVRYYSMLSIFLKLYLHKIRGFTETEALWTFHNTDNFSSYRRKNSYEYMEKTFHLGFFRYIS